jgi:CO/xanthine dehydrogenase FAD-binding subunit
MDSTYHEPQTLAEALHLLEAHPDAGIVAGGTDLVVGDRSGKRSLPAALIAIHRVPELRGVRGAEGGATRLGALVTHSELESLPAIRELWTALSDAAALVGSPATRHIGTIGGNLCNASPAMEAGSPLLVFEATVELASAAGTRRMPLGEFLVGPAKSARKPGELLTGVLLPQPPSGRTGSAYMRLEYRQAMEIAVVGAAALVSLDEAGRCVTVRLGLTAVAPTCVRAPEAEAILTGQTPSAALIARAAAAAGAAAKPIDDVRGSAAYRRAMVEVIAGRALSIAWRRAKGESIPNPAAAVDETESAAKVGR